MLISKTFSFWQQNFVILLSSTHIHNSVASKFIYGGKSLRQKNFPGGMKEGKINTLKVIIILYFWTTFQKIFPIQSIMQILCQSLSNDTQQTRK